MLKKIYNFLLNFFDRKFIPKTKKKYKYLYRNLNENEIIVSKKIMLIPNAPKKYQKIIFENNKIMVSFLPELGGRIYEFINKKTGNNELYKNQVWKETPWGKNNVREGKWKAIGGIELSFPDQEHGGIYDIPFEYKIVEKKNKSKTIKMWKKPDKLTYGLNFYIEVTLRPNKDYIQITSHINNPNSKPSKPIQYWINVMLIPGDIDPRKAKLEFIYPSSVKKIVVHSTGIKNLLSHQEINWPSIYSRYNNWKNKGAFGFFSKKQVKYQAIYSHKAHEGLVRVFANPQYSKIFGLGKIHYSLYSNKNKQYIELWSGITKDFWTYCKILPRKSITLTEYWYPIIFNKLQEKNLYQKIEKSIKYKIKNHISNK